VYLVYAVFVPPIVVKLSWFELMMELPRARLFLIFIARFFELYG
jgi:hypothetical protein